MALRKLITAAALLWFLSPLWLPSGEDLKPEEERVAEAAKEEIYFQLDSLRIITPKIVAVDVRKNPEFKHHLFKEGQVAWEVHLVGYTWFHIPWTKMRVFLVEDSRYSTGFLSLAGSIKSYWSAEWE